MIKTCVSVYQRRRLFKFRSFSPGSLQWRSGIVLKVFLCVFTKLREETLNFKLLLISPVEVRGAGEAYTPILAQ